MPIDLPIEFLFSIWSLFFTTIHMICTTTIIFQFEPVQVNWTFSFFISKVEIPLQIFIQLQAHFKCLILLFPLRLFDLFLFNENSVYFSHI